MEGDTDDRERKNCVSVEEKKEASELFSTRSTTSRPRDASDICKMIDAWSPITREEHQENSCYHPSREDEPTILKKNDDTGSLKVSSYLEAEKKLSIREIKVETLNLGPFKKKKGGSDSQKGNNSEKDNAGSNDDGKTKRTDVLTMISNSCSEIFEKRLFLSGYKFACNIFNLRKKKITHIINMAGNECPNKFQDTLLYRTYHLKDDIQEDIFYILLDVTYFIETVLNTNEKNKILVHCNKGISRSVIVIIFFLMNRLNLKFSEAFEIVKKRRQLSNPNLGFVTQLLRVFNLRGFVLSGQVSQKAQPTNGAKFVESTNTLPPGSVTMIFRIESTEKELTFTSLSSMSVKADIDTYSNVSKKCKPISIDERFNYVVTKNFHTFYLLLFDSTFENIYKSLFDHFVNICIQFFCNTRSTKFIKHIIRSDIDAFIARFQMDTKVCRSLSCNDVIYQNLQNVLQQIVQI
ncbi:protein tyrosine phosphatase [Plasmodium gonderi]|uniref:Protein tyrosine phosphatase n=1 Tax=Plasmodium gonderi TaxID=77519 RepID=A0A1Y1J8Y1_PLAGO|nr:protein tyrosine phosphatase [Plasmodium gonderi]GAW78969.1 protein tyrosine phosphatase [Plasmodium gonderi]